MIGINNKAEWYSEDFIKSSISNFLKENGYKIHKEEDVERGRKLIVASRFFTKEVIEIKGLPKESLRNQLLQNAAKDAYPNSTFKNSFAETLFNSLANFGKYYSEESADLAIAVPNIDRYISIIERLHEYFTANKLSLKIYLVNEDGKVEVSNMNENTEH